MKAYSIFDDFGEEPAMVLTKAGIHLDIHPHDTPRPDIKQLKNILEEYDCVIIGTSQKINADMFENISSPKIIATASVGLDHIIVPEDKKELVKIFNTPIANAQSVAEFTIGCALMCCKRITAGAALYAQGKDNKALVQKPEDLYGKTIGIIGAGNISIRIMEYARFFKMNVLCWTVHPENHEDLLEKKIVFVSIQELVKRSDVISVNLPNNHGTKGLISSALVEQMKNNAIFISISRLETIDLDALILKAEKNSGFYVCVDIDVDETVVSKLKKLNNIILTPHIGGGTIEARKRMFAEVADQIVKYYIGN